MTKVRLLLDKQTNFYFHVLCISYVRKGYSGEEYKKKYKKFVPKKVISSFKKIPRKEVYRKLYYCRDFKEAKEKLKRKRKLLKEAENKSKSNFEKAWPVQRKKLIKFKGNFEKFWNRYEKRILKSIERITRQKFGQKDLKFYLTLPIHDAFERFYGGRVIGTDYFFASEVLIHEIVHVNLEKLRKKINLPKSKKYALEELLVDLITFSVCKKIFGEKKGAEICPIKGEHRYWLDYLFLWELFLKNNRFDKFVNLLVYDFKTKRISFIAD